MSEILNLLGRFVVCCKMYKEIDVSNLQYSTILSVFGLWSHVGSSFESFWHIVISYLDAIYLFTAYLFTVRIIGQMPQGNLGI